MAVPKSSVLRRKRVGIGILLATDLGLLELDQVVFYCGEFQDKDFLKWCFNDRDIAVRIRFVFPTRFEELNSEPVTPDGLIETLDSWGSKMISAIATCTHLVENLRVDIGYVTAGGSGLTPWAGAVSHRKVIVAGYFGNKDADLIKRVHKGFVPLHYAATKGNEGVAHLLIFRGACVDGFSSEGRPLHVDASYGTIGALEILLEVLVLRCSEDTFNVPVRLLGVFVTAQDGDHKDNDYYIMCTGSGCCVCRGATDRKREGLCSKHKCAEKLVKKGGPYSLDIKIDTKSNISTTLIVFEVPPSTMLVTSVKMPDYNSEQVEVQYFQENARFATAIGMKPSPVVELSGTVGAQGLEFASAFSLEDGLKFAKLRGEATQDASDAVSSVMVTVIGLDSEKVQQLCDAANEEVDKKEMVQIANFLCRLQMPVQPSSCSTLNQLVARISPSSKVVFWALVGAIYWCFGMDPDDEGYSYAKFFGIKSIGEADVHKSIKYGVWSSPSGGNIQLDNAFRDADRISKRNNTKCLVFLFFSVNGSGHFCGMVEMVGPVDLQRDKWSGCFPVRWHIVKDIPNYFLQHNTLQHNENKPVRNQMLELASDEYQEFQEQGNVDGAVVSTIAAIQSRVQIAVLSWDVLQITFQVQGFSSDSEQVCKSIYQTLMFIAVVQHFVPGKWVTSVNWNWRVDILLSKKLAAGLKGYVQWEDVGFDPKLLAPDVQEVHYVSCVNDQDTYECNGAAEKELSLRPWPSYGCNHDAVLPTSARLSPWSKMMMLRLSFIGLGASRILREGECHGLGLYDDTGWLMGRVQAEGRVPKEYNREAADGRKGIEQNRESSSSSSGFGRLSRSPPPAAAPLL